MRGLVVIDEAPAKYQMDNSHPDHRLDILGIEGPSSLKREGGTLWERGPPRAASLASVKTSPVERE